MTAPPPVLIIGAGAMLDDLRDQVAQLGLQNIVRFCGWVDEPGPWVKGASVQACPSRDEAFSQTAVLAMGLGVPVVGTNVDGFPETLADRRGIMVSSEDPETLAAALEQILDGGARPDTEDYLALAGNVCAATEALVLAHNPSWRMAGGTGIHADWTVDAASVDFIDIETFSFDVEIPFTHEAWRGRMRSCNGIGATLPGPAVDAFDRPRGWGGAPSRWLCRHGPS
jgi:hypothetical protein